MKPSRWPTLALILTLLSACTPPGTQPVATVEPTPGLPTPQVSITSAPDAPAAMQAFLNAMQAEDYPALYALLSTESRALTSEEDLTKRIRAAFNAMSLQQMSYEILSKTIDPAAAVINYRVTYATAIVGDIQADITARLVLENGAWHVQWEDGLILPDLAGGRTLSMDGSAPARGEIYDRNGKMIAGQSDIVALGIVPGQINPETEEALLAELAALTGRSVEDIRSSYQYALPDWYIPVGETSAAAFNRRFDVITGLGGLRWSEYSARFYYEGAAASQAVGYVIPVPAEELDTYLRRGYRGDELVGYSGIEKWGEDYLSGKHGGALYVVNPDGTFAKRLAESPSEDASSLYLTIDRDLQQWAQQAIRGYNGAIVVMERDSGRVLAMASSPNMDTNLFAAANPNRILLSDPLYNSDQPMFNRAAQGEYPLGSVFKVITFSAALESGAFTPESSYECGYEFTELGDRTLYDWTWDHYLEDGETQPSGTLTLPEGLMRSCNPWFYHIGLELFKQGQTLAISDMARAFGLGQPTGIAQVAEASGNIEDPGSALEATNNAIGQGTVLVTPLQVARFMAAIGNGGTLYRPQLVEKVEGANGGIVSVFKPEAGSVLDLKQETLTLLQQTMRTVVTDARGTAYEPLRGLSIRVYGKTGTAETDLGVPHAWFAGYTDAFDATGLPDIAIAVVVEYGGEGSEYAAPMFRRVVEAYYFGRPRTRYWWESQIGVTSTPTLPVTATPEGGQNP